MIGQTFSHYRVTAKLGAGGMGEVYRATDTKLGRDVALKVLPPAQLADPVARAQLVREAQTASALNHPHVCHIYEVGEAEGHTFIAMELVEGQALSKTIPADGMATEQVLKYAEQMADALAHAHERNVLHRDLKCSNVVVTPEGRIKILDFGLAKRMEGVADAATLSNVSPLTQAGSIAGTLHYLAPEVLGGAPADARSELWALGVMVYEMAAGEPPFQGRTSFEVTSAILKDAPRPLPVHVPPGLRAVIQRCLAKEPGQRYQRAGEVLAALEAIGPGSSAESCRNLSESATHAIHKPYTCERAYNTRAGRNLFRRRPHMQGDFRIGEWLVQPQINQIGGNGKTTRVEPKAMQVLVHLAEHSDEVVPKEKLIRAVWADTFVTDDVLTRCISELRKAFDDDPRESRVIETIPKSGYRLLLEVRSLEPIGDRSRARVMLAVAATVIVTAGFLAWRAARAPSSASPAPASRVMLAVLPFVNLSNDPEQEYFSDGLTEEMIAQLGGLNAERLGVIARTSVMQYKGTKKTARQIGSELEADYLLESSVQRDGDRVRITTQLVRASNQTHLWTQSYDRHVGDILLVRYEVASAIAHHIRLQLPLQYGREAQAERISPQAYDAYLRGRFFWRQRTKESLTKGVEHFQRAIALEPRFALAYVGLADSHAMMADYGLSPQKDEYPQARAALLKALQIDETIAEAHTTQARLLEGELDWARAEKEYRRALELDPNYSSAHQWYANLAFYLGRQEESLREIQLALALDPLSMPVNSAYGRILFWARRYGDAAEQFRKTMELDPKHFRPHLGLGMAYCSMGRFAEAIAEHRQTVLLSDNHPSYLAGLGQCYAMAGQKQEARRILRELEQVASSREKKPVPSPVAMALLHISLGQKEQALRWLEAGYARRHNGLILVVDPGFDPLRSDPRFQDLLRRMNSPK